VSSTEAESRYISLWKTRYDVLPLGAMDSSTFQITWAQVVEQYNQTSSSHSNALTLSKRNPQATPPIAASSFIELCQRLDELGVAFDKFRNPEREGNISKLLTALLTQVDVLDRVADLGKITASKLFSFVRGGSSYLKLGISPLPDRLRWVCSYFRGLLSLDQNYIITLAYLYLDGQKAGPRLRHPPGLF